MGKIECSDPFPTLDGLRCWCGKYEELPERDATYRLMSETIARSWWSPQEVTDAVGVFLLVWNAAFYRGDSPDLRQVQGILERRKESLTDFRGRDLVTLREADTQKVQELFGDLLKATAKIGAVGSEEKRKKTPVGVGKALHVLAPNFFPAWDYRIARAYGCLWQTSAEGADAYVRFMQEVKRGLERLQTQSQRPLSEIKEELSRKARFPKTMLKFVDEFNYMKYTWTSRQRKSSGATA